MKKGWQTKQLGAVCEIIKGRKPLLKPTASNDDLPYLVAKVMRGSARPEYASVRDRNAVAVSEADTIIICDGSNSGEVFTGFRGILSSTMGKIAKKAEIDDDYLRAFLSATFETFNGAKTGAAIPHLDKEAMYQLEVPLPPLVEQRRLVSTLKYAFEQIDTARANFEKNRSNAAALYVSAVEAFFDDSARSWETVNMGSAIQTLTDYHANGSYEILKEHVELRDTKDFAWMVRSTDFENNFENELRYISKSAYEFLTKSRVFGGEIIMSKIGNAGKVYLMPEIAGPCSLAMNLFLIRMNNDVISNSYAYRYLKSRRGETQIRSRLKGAATLTITKESVRNLQIPLLPKGDQDRFVLMAESLEAASRRLVSLYDRKLAALEALKKSILRQAFAGELASTAAVIVDEAAE